MTFHSPESVLAAKRKASAQIWFYILFVNISIKSDAALCGCRKSLGSQRVSSKQGVQHFAAHSTTGVRLRTSSRLTTRAGRPRGKLDPHGQGNRQAQAACAAVAYAIARGDMSKVRDFSRVDISGIVAP
jgi:hypothetical protein